MSQLKIASTMDMCWGQPQSCRDRKTLINYMSYSCVPVKSYLHKCVLVTVSAWVELWSVFLISWFVVGFKGYKILL